MKLETTAVWRHTASLIAGLRQTQPGPFQAPITYYIGEERGVSSSPECTSLFSGTAWKQNLSEDKSVFGHMLVLDNEWCGQYFILGKWLKSGRKWPVFPRIALKPTNRHLLATDS